MVEDRRQIDLTQLPILTCWPDDGGPFITLPIVITHDPETGARNCGMYRMQLLDKRTTAMHWQAHKTGMRHFHKYKERGQKVPVAVVLGGDPALTYAATAPLPDGVDELLLAGFLRRRAVELVPCKTQSIWRCRPTRTSCSKATSIRRSRSSTKGRSAITPASTRRATSTRRSTSPA